MYQYRQRTWYFATNYLYQWTHALLYTVKEGPGPAQLIKDGQKYVKTCWENTSNKIRIRKTLPIQTWYYALDWIFYLRLRRQHKTRATLFRPPSSPTSLGSIEPRNQFLKILLVTFGYLPTTSTSSVVPSTWYAPSILASCAEEIKKRNWWSSSFNLSIPRVDHVLWRNTSRLCWHSGSMWGEC